MLAAEDKVPIRDAALFGALGSAVRSYFSAVGRLPVFQLVHRGLCGANDVVLGDVVDEAG